MIKIRRTTKANEPNINIGKPIEGVEEALKEFFDKCGGNILVDRYPPLNSNIDETFVTSIINVVCIVSKFDDEYFYIQDILVDDIFEILDNTVVNYSIGCVFVIDDNCICQRVVKLHLNKE